MYQTDLFSTRCLSVSESSGLDFFRHDEIVSAIDDALMSEGWRYMFKPYSLSETHNLYWIVSEASKDLGYYLRNPNSIRL